MPMDGLTLGFATREMNAILPGGRIDRITQPEKDTIVLLVRAGAANHRLLLCASPNNARCHFTNLNFPNPLEPRRSADVLYAPAQANPQRAYFEHPANARRPRDSRRY